MSSVQNDAAYGMLAAMEPDVSKQDIDDMSTSERDEFVAAHTEYEDFNSYRDALTVAQYDSYAASVGLTDFEGYKDNWYRTEIVQPALAYEAEQWSSVVKSRLSAAGYDTESLETEAQIDAAISAVTGYENTSAYINALKAALTESGNIGYSDIDRGYELLLYGFLSAAV